MTDMIPASMLPYLQTIGHALGGVLLFALGLSFGYKFIQASFMGRVNYWGGLERVHWLFHPVTMFVTPLFVHAAPRENNLIKTRTAGYVHLVWGPFFFFISLMLMVSGADYLGLPGTDVMNFVLTCGRKDIPPAITYEPPFTYKFPILKKARRTVFRMLTSDIYLDKNKTMNPFDDSKKVKLWEEDDEDRKEDELDRLRQAQKEPPKGLQQQQAQPQQAHPKK